MSGQRVAAVLARSRSGPFVRRSAAQGRAAPAPGRRPASARGARAVRGRARHDGARDPLRRRRGHGRRPARRPPGYTIASRRIEKVFPADDFSGVAIAGAAGPAVEMVKLFQVQLEHYEKVQGDVLSLEGKANQLGQLVRAQPAGRDAGLRRRAAVRRLRRARAAAAGCSPTTSPAAATRRSTTRRRARAASTPATGSRAGWREDMTADEAIDLAIRALFAAADEDVATGGPTSCAASSRPSPSSTPIAYRALADDEVAAAQPGPARRPRAGR